MPPSDKALYICERDKWGRIADFSHQITPPNMPLYYNPQNETAKDKYASRQLFSHSSQPNGFISSRLQFVLTRMQVDFNEIDPINMVISV